MKERLIFKNNEVSFNYFGQFGSLLADSDLLFPSNQSSGISISRANHRTYLVGIDSLILNDELIINFSYSRNIHKRETIEKLANGYIVELQNVIQHCLQPGSRGYTPSDFPLVNINQEELDEVLIANKLDDNNKDEGILL